MTKKIQIFALFLSAFYLTLSIGFGLRAHYCHEDISTISYASIAIECECGDESADMSCCSTVEEYFQFDEEIILTEEGTFVLDGLYPEVKNFQLQIVDQETKSIQSTTYLIVDNGPPKYLKHTSLILYA